METVIGIDPGKSTGVCVIQNGLIVDVKTMNFCTCIDFVVSQKPGLVVVEVSKTKAVWHKKISPTTSVNVGMVLRESQLMQKMLEHRGLTVETVQPRGKIDRARIELLTGYKKRSNQHERDAIMLAWNKSRFLRLIA